VYSCSIVCCLLGRGDPLLNALDDPVDESVVRQQTSFGEADLPVAEEALRQPPPAQVDASR
jgi:hypothetical protein